MCVQLGFGAFGELGIWGDIHPTSNIIIIQKRHRIIPDPEPDPDSSPSVLASH